MFAALIIQHAKCIRPIKLPSVACPSLPYFPSICHKRHDFREKFTELTICVFWLCTIFVRNTPDCKKNAEGYDEKFMFGLHVMYLLFLSEFNETWIFSKDFRKYSNISFRENPSSGSRVVPMRTDVGTDGDITNLILVFRNFAKARNKNSFTVSPECYSTTLVKKITLAWSLKQHTRGLLLWSSVCLCNIGLECTGAEYGV